MSGKNNSHPSPPTSHLCLFVDGAARGNPGPAGIGIFLKKDNKVLLEAKEYIGDKTNNEAEYIALLVGLEKASEFGDVVKVTSDSELLVNQVNGSFKVKQMHLKSLLNQVKEKISFFKSFSIKHVYRDNNKEADRLANEAIDEFLNGQRSQFSLDYTKQEKLF